MSETKHWTIADIKQANRAAGWHFFERATMRFFGSKILPYAYCGPNGVYFVTSEQFHPSQGQPMPRKYTVRRFNPETADVDTIGKFNYQSRQTAREVAKQLAR